MIAIFSGVKNFNAHSGCQKCQTVTTKDPATHRTYYGQIDDEPRNHDDFKRGVYVGHYNNATPLTDLDGCDTIADIISSEPMHFRDYGISRKCMRGWSEGKFSAATKWSPQVCKAISKDLE